MEQAKLSLVMKGQGWVFKKGLIEEFKKTIGDLEIVISKTIYHPKDSWTLSGPGFEQDFESLAAAFQAATELEKGLGA